MATRAQITSRRHWILLGWLLILAAYHMPWTSHPAAAFTLNAFDLAEQVGVHPAIRAESPALRTSILLWFAIPLVAAGVAGVGSLYENGGLRWAIRGLGAVIALRVIPPQEALRSPSLLLDDVYARGLFFLTVLGLGLVLLSIVFGSKWVWHVSLALVAILLPLVGFNRSWNLLHELQLDVTLGGGLIIYVGLLLLVGASMGQIQWQGNRQRAALRP